ncbi:hypothetical protein HGG75_20005 [Ochrobactrum pseudogrignonense]|nr:hypothetical protein [Brucella pseudogrignonensis]
MAGFVRELIDRTGKPPEQLVKEGNAWIEVVSNYCAGLGGDERALQLGLPNDMAASAKAMCLFVLTRNGAKFSGGEPQDSRAAWFSWFDLLKRCHSLSPAKTRYWSFGKADERPALRADVGKFSVSN